MRPRKLALAHQVGVVIERPHPGIQEDESLDRRAIGQGQGQADRPSVIVNDECEAVESEPRDKCPEAIGVSFRCVAGSDGPLRQAESQVIGRDAAMARRQRFDQMTELEGPRRSSVHEKQHVSLALVDIVQAALGEIGPP